MATIDKIKKDIEKNNARIKEIQKKPKNRWLRFRRKTRLSKPNFWKKKI